MYKHVVTVTVTSGTSLKATVLTVGGVQCSG